MKSTKTTAMGWMSIILGVLGFVGQMLQNSQVATDPQVLAQTATAIATGVGLIKAKDAEK